MTNGYLVALFDILGFEQKLASVGLAEMLARYSVYDAFAWANEKLSVRARAVRRVIVDN